MAEYIERQKVFDSLPIVTEDKKISLYGAVSDFMVMVYAIPSADVAPVRHGRWEFRRSEKHKFNIDAVCTACNTAVDSHPENNLDYRQTSIKKKLRYCPNCGAKMDLEDDHGR